MGLLRIKSHGDFENFTRFFKRTREKRYLDGLDKFGRAGVNALAEATPVDSGETAASWYYEIEQTEKGYRIVWRNSNVHDGAVIAILIQYGHGTGSGGYVQGIDYINPAMRNIFRQLAEDAWREVTQ